MITCGVAASALCELRILQICRGKLKFGCGKLKFGCAMASVPVVENGAKLSNDLIRFEKCHERNKMKKRRANPR